MASPRFWSTSTARTPPGPPDPAAAETRQNTAGSGCSESSYKMGFMGKPSGNVCMFLKSESLITINEELHNQHQILGNDLKTISNLLKQNVLKSSSSFSHLLLLWFKGPGLPLRWSLNTKSNREKDALVLPVSLVATRRQQILMLNAKLRRNACFTTRIILTSLC